MRIQKERQGETGRQSERAVTLGDEQEPGGASRQVQVVVGEATPPAQEADGEVGGHGAGGPGHSIRCRVSGSLDQPHLWMRSRCAV